MFSKNCNVTHAKRTERSQRRWVWRRPRRLTASANSNSEGLSRGYHAEVDLAALGRGLQALVFVRLQPKSDDIVSRFIDHVWSFARDDGNRSNFGHRRCSHPPSCVRCGGAANDRVEPDQQLPGSLRRTIVLTLRTPTSPCCLAGSVRALTLTGSGRPVRGWPW